MTQKSIFFGIAIEIWILEKDNRNDEQKTHHTNKIEWINIEQSVWWFNIAHFKVGLFIFFFFSIYFVNFWHDFVRFESYYSPSYLYF